MGPEPKYASSETRSTDVCRTHGQHRSGGKGPAHGMGKKCSSLSRSAWNGVVRAESVYRAYRFQQSFEKGGDLVVQLIQILFRLQLSQSLFRHL